MSKLNITKRDGSIVAYNPDKVVDAIMSAFMASKEGTLAHAQEIARSLNVTEGMSVEEIQNQVEHGLFKYGYFETAKNYILYRKEHTDTRETLERLKFLMDYCKAQNAATGSKFDANANVENKNIATLIGELPKGAFIRLNRKMLTDRIKVMYGNDLAKKYLDLLEHHFIYKNDETSLANYCASITMYPWLLNGTFSIGGNSKAPTNLKSFCGGFINMVFIVSSMLSGACMHKDQRIIVRKNGICYSVTSKQLIESYFVDGAKVETYNDTKNDWEFVRVSGLEVFEDGKFVDVTKVYRRKYNDLIYKVKTKDGYIAQVSKDHKFKQLFRDRTFESKAETLKVNDTLFMEKDFTPVVNFESPDWKKGWVVGHIVGNGNITQKNYVRLAVCYDYDFYGEIFTKYVKEWLDVDVLKRDGNRCWDYYANSETLYKALKEYIKGDNCYNKHIDTDNKSLDFLLGYLDGLFCADGSYIEDSGATFTTVSSESIQNVKDILGLINSFGHIRTDEAHDNKATTYTTHVRLCNCKYFKHLILKKRAFKSKRENANIHRDVYYYGANALKNATSNKRNLWCNSKRDDYKKTDVIDSIETFVNDDEYVYEIETRTHWYNCGGFITHNCATPEFLMYMNYFIGKEYGKDYWKNPQAQADLSLKKRTIDKVITDCFEQIVYSLNQPTGARNFQAVFWNVAYYDKYYFESLFGEFRFPDGEKPDWDGLSWLQKRFMKWFNAERTKIPITFPVETMALLTENGKPKDEEYGDFTAEMYSEGHSFFTYMSDNADSLSSCCRLRNEIQDNGFSYTLGAGGVSTGSKSVLTINLNRCIQYAQKYDGDFHTFLEDVIDVCHKVQICYNENLKFLQENGMLPLYDAGYINIKRQYLTIGINGLVEAAEYLGLTISPNEDYKAFVQDVLGMVEKANKSYCDKKKGLMFNCEMIPAENVGVKHAKWDKEDGYVVPRDCYNSYFYIVEDENTNVIDKILLHGKPYIEHLTGGSALHINLNEHLTKEQYKHLMKVAAKEGCNYITFNIPNTVCNDCGHITKHNLDHCPACGSKNVDYLTRIIGYLKRISNFSKARQEEAGRRYYAKGI